MRHTWSLPAASVTNEHFESQCVATTLHRPREEEQGPLMMIDCYSCPGSFVQWQAKENIPVSAYSNDDRSLSTVLTKMVKIDRCSLGIKRSIAEH